MTSRMGVIALAGFGASALTQRLDGRNLLLSAA